MIKTCFNSSVKFFGHFFFGSDEGNALLVLFFFLWQSCKLLYVLFTHCLIYIYEYVLYDFCGVNINLVHCV